MTTFFLFISFILNIISLLAIIVLFLRQNRMMAIEKNQKDSLKEMEDIISSFMSEMKEENEWLVNKIKSNQVSIHSEKAEKNDFQKSKTIEKVNQEIHVFEKEKSGQTNKIKKKHDDIDDKIKSVHNKSVHLAYKNQQDKTVNDHSSMNDLLPYSAEDKLEISAHLITQTDKNTPISFKEQLNDKAKSEDIYIQSLTSQVIDLYNNGMTIQQIAKQLNKGITEIELLLKFRS